MMPIKTQKMIALMIARAQNPAIMMAGTMPLNLDTFVDVHFIASFTYEYI